MSRPLKITKAMLQKASDYMAGEYQTAGDIVPSVAGLAHYLGVSRSTLYDNKAKNIALSDTLDRIAQNQERLLINGGLIGNFNATITKLMLANHGYSEKQQIDNTSSDGSMAPSLNLEVKPAIPLDPIEASNFYRDFMLGEVKP